MDEAWRTVTIPEETYIRLKAAEASLAEAVARAERAEQKAAPAPAATAEAPTGWSAIEIHDGFWTLVHSPDFATREQAESAAAKLADYDRLSAEVSRLKAAFDTNSSLMKSYAIIEERDKLKAEVSRLKGELAALQKPEGEPQTESE
jgi:hypothetical protein